MGNTRYICIPLRLPSVARVPMYSRVHMVLQIHWFTDSLTGSCTCAPAQRHLWMVPCRQSQSWRQRWLRADGVEPRSVAPAALSITLPAFQKGSQRGNAVMLTLYPMRLNQGLQTRDRTQRHNSVIFFGDTFFGILTNSLNLDAAIFGECIAHKTVTKKRCRKKRIH